MNEMSFFCKSFALIVFLLGNVLFSNLYFIENASANLIDSSGFGSRTAALGGAGVSWGFDSFAAYYNPAGLALESDKRLSLALGVVYMKPNFIEINNIVVQNSYTNPEKYRPTFGEADTNYRPTFGQTFGISYHLFPEFANLSIGFVTFLPLQQLAYMDTGEAYAPEYVLYRSRSQRPQFETGVGLKLGEEFSVGAGVHVAYTLSSDAPISINTEPNSTSSMRFTSSMKPRAAPYFGLLYVSKSEESDGTRASPLTFGAVIRFPASFDNVMNLSSSAQLFTTKGNFPFNFKAKSTLYYDPLAFELGGSVPFGRKLRFYGQLDYQYWSQFKVPAMQVEQVDGIAVSPGIVPNFQFRNTVTPRIGAEYALKDNISLRLGYSYHASVLKGSLQGDGNYLDPSKHMLGAGFGWEFSQFFGAMTPTRLDFHVSYQRFLSQQITKNVGDEKGNPDGKKIGAPGYEAGGNIFGGGVSLTLGF